MKKLIYTLSLGMLCAVSACSDWTEIETTQVSFPVEKSEAYYANIRAYKATMKNREVAFGWFGNWTAKGASRVSRLTTIPDSVDIVSIWGRYDNLDADQKADLKFVQEKLGTKVTYTIFAHEVPEPFEATTEGVQQYAKALADTASKYNYDGIDLDYEPGFGGRGPLVGNSHDNELMKDFCEALSQYFGPASGTDKLLIIDGVPYAVHKEIAPLFDYGIVQAYDCGYADNGMYNSLQHRFSDALKKGWKPEQYIFAEDFEKNWRTGGVRHLLADRDENGQNVYVQSLKGMALFKPTIDGEKAPRKGGCGTYHMEYEYAHPDVDYKYLREAIQLMNPAKK